MMDSENEALAAAAEYAIGFRDAHRPLHATASADDLRRSFGVPLPERGEDGRDVIDRLIAAAEPGLVGNTEPGFHAWVMGGSHPTGVAADWLTSAWGQNAGIYQCSPAAATAEETAARWILDLADLPREASVGFSTGATMSAFTCLAAARGEVLARAGYDFDDLGLAHAPAVTVFHCEEVHITNLSALRYLGFGRRDLVSVTADAQGRMVVGDLAEKLAQCSGPRIILATAGHINSGAFDDFDAIADLAAAHGAWVHVDAAFGLWARASAKARHLTKGIDRADSWSTDGHKWLQVPYDSGFAIVRHAEAHRRAMDITASYLSASPEDGRNPTHFTPELSRRARGFAVWATLRALGRAGVAEMVDRHCACARQIAETLAPLPGIDILNDVVLNQITLSFRNGTEDLTEAVAARLNADPGRFVRTAVWQGRPVLRLSIIARDTELAHANRLAAAIAEIWDEIGLPRAA